MLKLCTFSNKGISRVGILRLDGKVIDLEQSGVASLKNVCRDMISVIEGGDEILSNLHELANRPPDVTLLSEGSYKLLAPIPRPKRNVFCVGKNYLDHVHEINKKAGAAVATDLPKFAQFFTKAPECVIATGDHVPAHIGVTKWLDYEVELAVIIGKVGKNISADKALDHVYGWSIGNDVTARDVQKNHVQFFKGKTLDGSCPMGPCIVPRSSLDVSDISMKLWVNEGLRQNGRTSQMIFKVPEIILQLSAGFTLRPGDIILTGTPAGVGYAMSPPQSLKPGDSIKIEVEHIGVLENLVI